MEKHKLLYPIIIGISIAVGILLANLYYQQAEQTTGFAIPKKVQGNKFDEIMYLLDNNYVDVIDKNALTEEFIPQILKFLDPHSAYLTPEEVAESATELQGSFSGIGVQFNIQNDTVMIVSVIPGGPSEKLGILPGDRIIAVNDSSFVGADVTNATVLKTLRGEKGSIVKVRIKRNGSLLPLDFDIVRGDVPVKSIDVVYVIADSTGYVKISNFGANTYREFLDALVILREQECNNIIVDLRNNSGGYLSAVIQMTNEFLKRGQLIVYTEGVNQAREDAIADGSDGPVGCYEDFSHADVIMLIGANIADNHPILKLHIAKNRKTTGKKPTIIVVDPRFSKTANMADIYVPILPRSDLSLMNGLCYIILEQGWEDEKFISNRTTGYKEFRKHIFENYKPQDVSITTGIEVKDLYQLAKVYAKAPKAKSAFGL